MDAWHHPLFWDSGTRLSFLRDVSDRVELEDRENESELLNALESIAAVALKLAATGDISLTASVTYCGS